jgi:signal transduction histidine kinase
VPLEGKLLIDASFLPLMLAIAFLGPAAALVIVAASELGAWTIQRYRIAVVPINLFAVGATAVGGAASFGALDLSPGLMFYFALAGTGAVTLFVNDLVITTLIGILDGSPIRDRLRSHAKLIPALAINVALVVAAANIYVGTGLEVVLFVCGLIVAFNYMVRQTLLARDHARRVEELAASRGRLVAQTLDTEARERRALAESLHDGALQTLLCARQDLEDVARGGSHPLGSSAAAVDEAVRQLRTVVTDLHPAVVDRAGLAIGLRQIVKNAAIRGGFDASVSVDAEAEGIEDRLLLSLARELVTNVTKHARAESLTVSVMRQQQALTLEVVDDGVGFDAAASQNALSEGHIGLASCSERCAARNGRLLVETARGGGTRIIATIPVMGLATSRPSPRATADRR